MPDPSEDKLILFNDAALRRDQALEEDGFGLEERLSPVYRAILSKATQTPFSIMFSGGWGTGKTSAMRWMDDFLRKTGNGKNGTLKIDTCWFYPWKYQDREDVWKGLIAEVILSTMDLETVDANKVIKAAKQFGKFLGGSFVRVLSGLKFKLKPEEIETSYDLKEGLSGIIDEYGKHVTPQAAYFNAFEQALTEWIESCYPNQSSRLVIFIDDLDRCLPAIALQVLEAIKLYLNIPEVVVVVGVDRQVIDATVVKHYKEALGEGDHIETKARLYLDKMFQVEVLVPPQDSRVKTYLTKQLDRMDIWNKLDPMHRSMFKAAIGQIADINPRSVIRALNTAIVGAGSGNDPLLIAQSIQQALISAVLHRECDGKFHDLCLREDGRRFLYEWTRAVIDNPLKRRIFASPTEHSQVDGLGRLKAARLNRTEQTEQLAHLVYVANRFPAYREVMMVDTFRNLVGLQFPPDESWDGPEVGTGWTKFQEIVAEILGVANVEVTKHFLASLERLDLENSQITDSGLIHLQELTSLQWLSLRETKITDEGMRHLAGIISLKALYLERIKVTDAGLAHLQGLTSLEQLGISETNITDAGLVHIKGLHSLQQLGLSDTNITDAGLWHLRGLKSLKTLYVFGTEVTDAGVAELKLNKKITVHR